MQNAALPPMPPQPPKPSIPPSPPQTTLPVASQPIVGRLQDLEDFATVVRVTDLSPTIRELELRPDAGVRNWSPGSHLTVGIGHELSDGQHEVTDTRTYSLVGLPQPGGYRIAVKRLSPGRGGSRFMWRLAAGDRIAIGGPRNHFPLPLEAPRYLLVAGGIGITPLLGMAQTLAARQADVAMCYAARTGEELVYLEPLRQALGSRLQTYSSQDGQRLDLVATVAALPADVHLLVCGPLSLLNAARAAWAGVGRPVGNLRFETFGASGTRPEEPFWIEVAGRTGRLAVGVDTSMLDALNLAGVETLYDCLRGECGLCAVDILRLEGEVDHRDVFLSDEEKHSNRRICTCVSRVAGGGVVIDTGFRADD
jgi:ferredoxin-NADP reductase